ncbi:unnamed protein product [Caretta caretta]
MLPLVAQQGMPVPPVGDPGPQAGSPSRCRSPRKGTHVWGTRMVPRLPVYPEPVGSGHGSPLRTCMRAMALSAMILVTGSSVRRIGIGTPRINAFRLTSDVTRSSRSGNVSE